MNGFDYIRVVITEATQPGNKRYRSASAQVEAEKERAKSLGIDVDAVLHQHRAKRKAEGEEDAKKQSETDAKKKAARIQRFLRDTSKKGRIKMWLTHPATSIAATNLRKDAMKASGKGEEIKAQKARKKRGGIQPSLG